MKSNWKETQLFVVDDDDDVRQSVEWTLGSVGLKASSFSNAQACLQACDVSQPVCLVVDLLLPGMTGINLCERLSDELQCFEFVMITGYGDVESAVLAMKLGAVDFIEKPLSRERLLQSVNRAMDDLSRCAKERSLEEVTIGKFDTLTTREQEIFQCVASGMLSKQIARKLDISVRTVDVHRSNIMKKLGIDSPSQLGFMISVLNRRRRRAEISSRTDGDS